MIHICTVLCKGLIGVKYKSALMHSGSRSAKNCVYDIKICFLLKKGCLLSKLLETNSDFVSRFDTKF